MTLEGAACAELDAKTADRLFFGTALRVHYDDALTYCDRCPVRSPCLEDALEYERGGPKSLHHVTEVRGGLTPAQRIELLNREATR